MFQAPLQLVHEFGEGGKVHGLVLGNAFILNQKRTQLRLPNQSVQGERESAREREIVCVSVYVCVNARVRLSVRFTLSTANLTHVPWTHRMEGAGMTLQFRCM